VFERFYRTRSALSGRARGSGLGLAIVKHIVHQLGGEMGVSSKLGKGSDFYFGLRMAEEH
jgi:two-component system phosphate regulon sensor histidine kinase PhoR